jgi:hypothetical protein
MPSPAWIATIVGLGGGLVLALALAQLVLPRWVEKSAHMHFLVRLALAGTLVALLPALVLAVVVGGTLGEVWGERALDPLGFPASGAPIGLAVGIALVFALVTLAGTAGGVFLGKAVLRYRERRPRS